MNLIDPPFLKFMFIIVNVKLSTKLNMKKASVILLILALGCFFTACSNSNSNKEEEGIYDDTENLDEERLYEEELTEEDSLPVDDLEEPDTLNVEN